MRARAGISDQRADEKSVLIEIGRIITSSLDIREVYERFAAEVRKILPFERISINWVDAPRGRISVQHVIGRKVPEWEAGDDVPLQGTVTAQVVASRRGIRFQPKSEDEFAARFPGHVSAWRAGFRSALLAPLIYKGVCFGSLVLMASEEGRYTEKDLAVAEHVAAQISGAIAHSRLLLECMQAEESLKRSELDAKRMAGESAAMAAIGRIISSAPDIESVYPRFAEEAHKVIPFDRIAVNLIDAEGGTICAQYYAGMPIPGRGPGETFPLSGSLAEEVCRTKRTALFSWKAVGDVAARFPTAVPLWQAGLRSILISPLIAQDRPIGTLAFISREPSTYTQADAAVAEKIASQISGAVANARLLLERTRAEEALEEREASLKSIFRAAPVGIGLVCNRVLKQVNDRICEMTGHPREALIGKSARVLYPDEEEFERVGRLKYAQIRAQGSGSVETRWRRSDGAVIDVLLSSTPLDPQNWGSGVTFTALDITERNRAEQVRADLEEKLRQAQKMEAIGTLAGGIAHDFNNILAAIIGFAELSKIEGGGNPEVVASLNEVLKASFRARDLVRQILTFSRQAATEFGPVRMHLIVKEVLKLMRASLPATVELRQEISDRGTILGDPTQIHQVLMNLCTNAYQAMRDGGGLLEVILAESFLEEPPAPGWMTARPGRYLKLSVRDTGHGIDPTIIDRIFDPYFTTKEKGKGTGLGLAVVHGIVKSHGGTIRVSSRVGEGSVFDLYFPLIDESAQVQMEAGGETAASGREAVLFVDDEPAIAEMGQRLIASLGYQVSTCGNAAEALELFRLDPRAFDLVITDMTMPGMTGAGLAVELMRMHPGLPVILCTGFSEQITDEKAQSLGIRALIPKPFLKHEIAAVIRDALDSRPAAYPSPAPPA